ncbi:type VII secretion protein EccB [Prauserella cavernicola]|uniref:Type VII secretion protein EccB n=1 Tax=Prauserella cavernicola TaxID=2800127 RepID=A0A934QQ42_9PSEU|nr:type VII secretion protein EccB [Prauserella cavernicola]MBK1784008.1 type VII secretion protein EccB [Prauserella cavernicola]
MPSTPTTKSQVQAYQFVLRRMQSALVRKDAVMLHDPMRTHSRATIVGVVLSAIAMLGFVIFGIFKPAAKAPDSGIVIGEQSGSIYVVAGSPKKLIPTFNMASARLILMGQQQSGEGEQGGNQQAAAPAEVPPAEVVPDEQLQDIPRGRLQGIPDGPDLIPSKDQMISSSWAVCDEVELDTSLNPSEQFDPSTRETTVFGGVDNLGRELAKEEALLAAADDGRTYLIYRQSGDGNTVRAAVDMDDSAVTSALNLQSVQVRKISMGLLNAIPAVGDLSVPDMDNLGGTPQFNLNEMSVGSVFRIEDTTGVEFWVVLDTGIQQIPASLAEMIRFTESTSDELPTIAPSNTQAVTKLQEGTPGALNVSHYPEIVPTVLKADTRPVSCLGWKVQGEGAERDARTALYVNPELPGPKNDQGEVQRVKIGQPSPDGWKVEYFYMQPGFAAAVRGATTKETFERGSIQLISDRGVRYGIPNDATAAGLGLSADSLKPAPESIIKLLPVGASLNAQDAQRTYDGVQFDPSTGSFPDDAAAAGN